MFHHFGTVTNTRGDSLPGWQVEVVQLTDGATVIPIYAAEDSTPISSVSGITNRAVADAEGNFDFFVSDGTYSLKFYDAAGVQQRIQRYLPMYGGHPTGSGGSQFASIEDYGALGGGADDTAAFVAAMAAAKAVFVPAGTWLTSNLASQQDNQFLFGVGPASRLQFKAGSTGYHFSSNGHETVLRDLDFYGGDDGGKATVASAASTRSGVKLDYDIACRVSGVSIHGYDAVGIGPANVASSVAGLCSVTDCNVYSCWQGIVAGFAEYTRWIGVSVTSCRQGFYLSSGNVTLASSLIEYNYDNLYIEGFGDANNAHGGVTNCRLNHATHFAVYGNALTNGHSFIGNDIFYGQISLTGCDGLRFLGNTISISAIGISGGGRNIFRDNFVIVDTGLDNTVTQIGGNTVFENNFLTDGSPIWSNSAPIFGQEVFTSGDQTILQLRENGAGVTAGVINDGFLITSNGGTGLTKIKPRSSSSTSSTALMAWNRASGNLGFFGAAPVAQQSVSAAATDPATTMALANSLRTALINLGLAV